jgi:spermidine synthase
MKPETDSRWFTELCEEGGSALSLQIHEKLHDEKTGFQRIEIYSTTHFGNLMVIDGFVMLTSLDNFLYHEMMSHPALFTHPDPKRVVIIGGGDCGTLREVLKHQGVEQVLQVAIDERVTRLSEKYFPDLCESNNDARAGFYFGDGIQWMKDAAGGRPPWRVKKIFATSAKTMRNKRGSRRGTTTPPFTWAHWPNRNSS